MKFSQRLLSLLLCFVLLSAVFSVSVSAEDIDAKDFQVKVNTTIMGYKLSEYKTLMVYPGNDAIESAEYVYPAGIPAGQNYFDTIHWFEIRYINGDPLLKKDRKSSITLNNAYVSKLIKRNGVYQYDRGIDDMEVRVYYTDGSEETLSVTLHEKPSNALNNFTLEITPKADILSVQFVAYASYDVPSTINTDQEVTVYAGEFNTDDMSLAISIQSEEAGLLTGIIEWLKGIKEGITNVFESIAELPAKIWSFIQNGLQSLFVPNEEFIVSFKEDMESMLEEKLGAVYQVLDITFDSWDKIKNYDEENTVELPLVSINLLGGKTFEFGGFDVPIVPNGFEFLATMVKSVVGVICTLWFVNGLRKRYDEIMGVEQ